MTKLFLVFLLSLFFAAPVAAQAPSTNQTSAALTEARTLFQAGRYDETIAQLQGAEATQRPVAYLLGLAWYRKRDYVRAIPHLQTVVRAGNEAGAEGARQYFEAVQALGLAHYLLGHLAEAVSPLEQVVAHAPNNELIYALGMASAQTRQPDKARAAFARMFNVAADSAAAHLLTAQMMIRAELDELAEAELKKALEKDPRLPQANFLLGQQAINKARYEEGIALLEKELALNPNNAMAHYRIGDAFTRQLKWEEAIIALQKSVWLYPFYSGPYILLGKSYLKKREFESAEGMLRRAIQFDPNNKSAHYTLGQVYQQMGRTEDARRQFATAEKLLGDPEKPER